MATLPVAGTAALENVFLHPDDEVAKRRAQRALDTKAIRRRDPEYKQKASEVDQLTERFWYERRCEGASDRDLSEETTLLFKNTKKNILEAKPQT